MRSSWWCVLVLGGAVACGEGEEKDPAEETDGVEDTEVEVDTEEPVDTELPAVSHATDIQPIWDERCTPCHIGGGTSGDLALDSGHAALVGVASSATLPYVDPGDADGSYLWLKLNDTHLAEGGTGGAMPLGGQLGVEELATIEGWILGGALE